MIFQRYFVAVFKQYDVRDRRQGHFIFDFETFRKLRKQWIFLIGIFTPSARIIVNIMEEYLKKYT